MKRLMHSSLLAFLILGHYPARAVTFNPNGTVTAVSMSGTKEVSVTFIGLEVNKYEGASPSSLVTSEKDRKILEGHLGPDWAFWVDQRPSWLEHFMGLDESLKDWKTKVKWNDEVHKMRSEGGRVLGDYRFVTKDLDQIPRFENGHLPSSLLSDTQKAGILVKFGLDVSSDFRALDSIINSYPEYFAQIGDLDSNWKETLDAKAANSYAKSPSSLANPTFDSKLGDRIAIADKLYCDDPEQKDARKDECASNAGSALIKQRNENQANYDWKSIVDADPSAYSSYLKRDWRTEAELKPIDLIVHPDLKSYICGSDLFKNKEKTDPKTGLPWSERYDSCASFVNAEAGNLEEISKYLASDWKERIEASKNLIAGNTNNSSSPGASENSNELPGATENPSSTGKGMSKNDGGGSVANQLLALGTGIIGSNILLSCKLGSVTPSIIAFGAGSMTYIGSEIFGAKAQQAFIKVKKDEIAQLKATMTQGGDLQRGIIEAKIKETEEKLAFVKKRKTWTTAVTAMYGAATGLAAMEFACTKNIITLPSCTQWTAAICDGASSLPSSLVLHGAVVGAYGLAVGNAGGSAVSTFGTALASLGLLVKGVSSTVAVAYQTPETRIATFGVGTALAAKVMADLGKVEGDLKNNINDLKALLADYDKKTQDAGGIDEGAGAVDLAKDNVNLMQGSGNVNRMAIGDDMNKHCWGKDSQGLQTYSEEACNNSLTLAKPKYSSKFSLPTLQSVANTGVDMAQAVARGDMGAADIAAANLASNAMRVQEVTDKLLNDIAEQQKKAGKKPVDYQKAIQDGVAKMHKDLNKSLGKQGIDLAKLPAGSSLLDAKDYANPSNEINTAKASLGAGSNESAGMNLNLDEGSSDELLFNRSANVAAVSHTLEDFETQESDILARPEESIFKQLSNRYFLNYNKIFETKSAPPAQSK